ncbi:MAG TPA: SDR family NAD(P)-dependent oxidoreductase, partial [Pseudomonadales bacterium]|nr:SDR family NAD(P)-dependent oxidoreductase [Pseudomonadales bacterium]
MAGRVEGKVVVVTGAASGLGLADAKALVAEGAQVVMTDINADSGVRLAEELGATFFAQDVSDEASWVQLMASVSERFGRLDGLVNNAGIAVVQDIEHATTDVWRKTIAIHLDGTFFGCRAAFPVMKASGGGS